MAIEIFSDVVKSVWSHATAKHAHLRMAIQVDNRSRLLSDLVYQLEKRLSEETHLDDETLAVYESQTALLEDHMALVRKCAAQLDNSNTIDHRTPLDAECVFLFEMICPGVRYGKTLNSLWTKYVAQWPEKLIRQELDMVKPLSFKDEVAKYMEKMQEKTRKNRMTQKVINEMRIAHQKGWFFVFDTLTLADDRLQAFNENPNALRDYFRTVGRAVLRAEGRSVKDSYNDCYRYLCVPEFGGQHGRLHWHVVHMVRTLPLGSHDPNFGRKVRNYRQINSFRGMWPYGFTQPIAVRYQHDAYSRKGWLWPVDKSGKAMQSKPYQAVAWYVTKYVAKQSDQRQKAITERQKKCKNPLMAICLKKEFRVRSSRKLGMELPSMAHLSNKVLLELSRISFDSSPLYQIVKENAKKQLTLNIGALPLHVILDVRPEVRSMLKNIRRLMKKTPEFNWQSSIASMTVTLKNGDISDEARRYIIDAGITPFDLRAKATQTFGGK